MSNRYGCWVAGCGVSGCGCTVLPAMGIIVCRQHIRNAWWSTPVHIAQKHHKGSIVVHSIELYFRVV